MELATTAAARSAAEAECNDFMQQLITAKVDLADMQGELPGWACELR
jgi:hypothetical protein